jgi:hypothetical protein
MVLMVLAVEVVEVVIAQGRVMVVMAAMEL